MTDPDPLAARVHALIAQWREMYPLMTICKSNVDDYSAGKCSGVNKFADALEADLAAAPPVTFSDTTTFVPHQPEPGTSVANEKGEILSLGEHEGKSALAAALAPNHEQE